MGEIRHSSFRPAWWARSAHVQTLWPSLFRRRPNLSLERQRLELPDGDFIDLALADGDGPTVLVVHGLEGGLQSHYAGNVLQALRNAGFRPVFMFLRGRSGEPNRLPRSYHSGASEDLAAVLDLLTGNPAGPVLAVVGYSLGGNMLLKYLGERDRPLVRAAVAVSVPFVLRDAMLRLNLGMSRVYQRHLLKRLKTTYREKFARLPSPLDVDLDRLRNFFEYDDRVTAPLNGFAGAEDYYARCSCRPFLPRITTPTLILHSRDDPFMFPHTVPRAAELGPGVTLELSRRGGHVGFVTGALPWRTEYWLESRIVDFLRGIAGSPVGSP